MANAADVAVAFALAQLGKPYQWGATGPDTYDCSGLTMTSYAHAGITIGRTTYDQITDGVAIAVDQIEAGDLVFPETGHVQLAIGNGRVVEAPQTGENVRIVAVCWGGTPIAVRRIAAQAGNAVSQFGANADGTPQTSAANGPKVWTGTPNITVTALTDSTICFQPRPNKGSMTG